MIFERDNWPVTVTFYSTCYSAISFYHRSHTDWPGIELGPRRWEAGNFNSCTTARPLQAEEYVDNTCKFSSYLTVNTNVFNYKCQSDNAAYEPVDLCLWGSHKYTVWAKCRVILML